MTTAMEDEERQQLMAKMDREMDEFIQERAQANKENPSSGPEEEQSLDELAEELRTHPAFLKEIDPSKPLHPAVEGLQALMYESDEADQNAESYKEDGNQNFKRSKYRWAIDNYTAGIKEKAVSKELNAMLYSNRAASHFRIGNHRSSFNDCIIARKFKPDHMKAIFRGAQCCMELQKLSNAIKWCDDGLLFSPTDEKLLELRAKADKLKKQQEKEKRRRAAQERKDEAEEDKMLEAVQTRGICLAGSRQLMLSSLESHHPSGAKVYLDQQGVLHWPVIFLYPEYHETDFVTSFSENDNFLDHLNTMFGSQTERSPWDADKKYVPDRIQVYYEVKQKGRLQRVKKSSSLLSVLASESYQVEAGTPAFMLIVKDSAFAKDFISKYES